MLCLLSLGKLLGRKIIQRATFVVTRGICFNVRMYVYMYVFYWESLKVCEAH